MAFTERGMISLRTVSVRRQAMTIQLLLSCHLIISGVHSWRIHSGHNRDRERDKEQMSCIRLCGSFHIMPEPGQGPIVSHFKSIRKRLFRSNTVLSLFAAPQMDQKSAKSLDTALAFNTYAKAGGCPTKS